LPSLSNTSGSQARHHGGAFKARGAIEAIAGHRTVNEVAGVHKIHPSRVTKWETEALARLPEVLADDRHTKAAADLQIEGPLYQEIGRLTMEVEYLEESLGFAGLRPRSISGLAADVTGVNKKEDEAEMTKILLLHNAASMN